MKTQTVGAKHLVLFAGLVLVSGCVRGTKVQRLDSESQVVFAYAQDNDQNALVSSVPDLLRSEVNEQLAKRNLAAKEMAPDNVAASFTPVRDSQQRFHLVRAQAGGAPFAVLVETKATFFSQLSGRWRWTVHGRVLAGKSNGEGTPVVESFEIPVFLQQQHEREMEAIAEAAPAIARRVAAALDNVLAVQQSAAHSAVTQ